MFSPAGCMFAQQLDSGSVLHGKSSLLKVTAVLPAVLSLLKVTPVLTLYGEIGAARRRRGARAAPQACMQKDSRTVGLNRPGERGEG